MQTGVNETRDAVNAPLLAREGVRLGLDDDTFKRWWATAISREAADEFVHLLGGTLDEARFVAALDKLTTDDPSHYPSGVIVQAYVLANNLPVADAALSHVKYEAQRTFDAAPVQMLMDAVRYNHSRQARARVEAQAIAKIDELFHRSHTMITSGEEVEDVLKVENLALDASLRFMGTSAKERQADITRRDKLAHRAALERSKQSAAFSNRAPTAEEAKLALTMLKETLGPEEFAAVISHVTNE